MPFQSNLYNNACAHVGLINDWYIPHRHPPPTPLLPPIFTEIV